MRSIQTLVASALFTLSASAFAAQDIQLPANAAQALFKDVNALAKAEANNITCMSFGAITTWGTSCPLKAIYCSKNSQNAWAQVKDGSYKALATSASAVCRAIESSKVKLEGDANGNQFRVLRSVTSSSNGSRSTNGTVTTTYFASGTAEVELPKQGDDIDQPESIVAELRSEGYRYLAPHTPENFLSKRVLVLSSGVVKSISKDGTAAAQTEVLATLGSKIMSNISSLALRLDSTSQVQREFNQGPTACFGGEPTVTLLLTDSASAPHAAMQHAPCKAVTVDSVGIDDSHDIKSLNKVGYAIKQLYDLLSLASADIVAVRD